ncbi:hypothetical protein IE81DRAFT_213449 [Ceraceosorus guamensis]|uniref:Uncharacterized protein n=1 Tax=Ceraceosorus guamensis TaxID=1522189 RepID=A0A316W638_9BASI|nr:hypothetical protein IE81DRAFT_213449 [Ceraceosorus guamensis]PWN45339.1 hypothetical protein IE81DRAFT_213449 [Ceraceosorus guamensis]
MSKLPPQHLWSRATASSSGRTLRAASFGAHHASSRHTGFAMSGLQRTPQSSHAASSAPVVAAGTPSPSSLSHSSATSTNSHIATGNEVPGAVSAPFFGPQPRAVVEADVTPTSSASQSSSLLSASSTNSPGLGRSNLSLQSQALIPYAALVNHAHAVSASRRSTLLAPQPMRRYFSVSSQAAAPGGIASTSAPALPPSSMHGKAHGTKHAHPKRLRAKAQTDGADVLRVTGSPLSRARDDNSPGKSSEASAVNRYFVDLLKGSAAAVNAGQPTSSVASDVDADLSDGGSGQLDFFAQLPPNLTGAATSSFHSAADGVPQGSSPSFTPPPSPGPAQSPPARDGNVPSGKSMQPARATGSSTDGDAPSALSSSPPSAPASSSSASAGHHELQSEWERAFQAPRSQRHDYTLEHGAYGIPKRHPLSAITSSSASRKGKGREQAPRSQLAQMGDFLTGSSVPSEPGLGPVDAVEARRAALSGGSTAQGDEAFWSRAENGTGNRRCIRDADGRVIRDRLRSVQVGEDAYFLRPVSTNMKP